MRDKMKNRTEFYIKPASVKGRENLVNFLESQGYGYQGFMDREDVMTSFLPVVADMKEKIIRRLGNVTMAACAVSSGVLISEGEFYKIYKEKTEELGRR